MKASPAGYTLTPRDLDANGNYIGAVDFQRFDGDLRVAVPSVVFKKGLNLSGGITADPGTTVRTCAGLSLGGAAVLPQGCLVSAGPMNVAGNVQAAEVHGHGGISIGGDLTLTGKFPEDDNWLSLVAVIDGPTKIQGDLVLNRGVKECLAKHDLAVGGKVCSHEDREYTAFSAVPSLRAQASLAVKGDIDLPRGGVFVKDKLTVGGNITAKMMEASEVAVTGKQTISPAHQGVTAAQRTLTEELAVARGKQAGVAGPRIPGIH
jgi:hypothetical protein